MDERLEESNTEELLTETPPEILPEPNAPAWAGPSWLRLAYALEFLIALIAVFMVWSEVGGQGHMDLLPWYIKLGCSLSLTWCCVRFTAGIVEHEKVWNPHAVTWFTGIILISATMAGITYYYHLHEVPEDTDEDSTQTSLIQPTPSRPAVVEFPGSSVRGVVYRGTDNG